MKKIEYVRRDYNDDEVYGVIYMGEDAIALAKCLFRHNDKHDIYHAFCNSPKFTRTRPYGILIEDGEWRLLSSDAIIGMLSDKYLTVEAMY